jgi:hypothetical protein
VQTFSVAIVGEYVVRAYREAQGRPPWVVRRAIGFGPEAGRAATPSGAVTSARAA